MHWFWQDVEYVLKSCLCLQHLQTLDKALFKGSLNAPLNQRESEGKFQKPKVWRARNPKKKLNAEYGAAGGHLSV